MPIHAFWDNPEKTVVVEVVEGKWDLMDVHNLLDEVNAMFRSVPHRVDIIVDMRQTRFVPDNVIAAMSRSERFMSPNLGIIVIVNAPLLARALINAVRMVAPGLVARSAFVNSIEDARKILSSRFQSMQQTTSPA